MEYLNPAGAYLMDNGRVFVLWLGQALQPAFIAQVRSHRGSQLAHYSALPG